MVHVEQSLTEHTALVQSTIGINLVKKVASINIKGVCKLELLRSSKEFIFFVPGCGLV